MPTWTSSRSLKPLALSRVAISRLGMCGVKCLASGLPSNLAYDLAELVEACANVEEAPTLLRAMKVEAAEAEMTLYRPRVPWKEAAAA
jgi:hypothetical protein